MAELSRAQLWQWRHHEIELTSGVTVSSELVDRLFREETASLRASLGEVVWAQGRFDRAAELLRTWTEHDTLLPFFTVATSPELATPSDDPSHEISH
jgi:malate synthase